MALATKKIRVYELARELGVENQVVLDLAEELKIGVKSHSSSIDDPSADRVRRLADSRELRGEPIVEEPKPVKGKAKAEKPERAERPGRGGPPSEPVAPVADGDAPVVEPASVPTEGTPAEPEVPRPARHVVRSTGGIPAPTPPPVAPAAPAPAPRPAAPAQPLAPAASAAPAAPAEPAVAGAARARGAAAERDRQAHSAPARSACDPAAAGPAELSASRPISRWPAAQRWSGWSRWLQPRWRWSRRAWWSRRLQSRSRWRPWCSRRWPARWRSRWLQPRPWPGWSRSASAPEEAASSRLRGPRSRVRTHADAVRCTRSRGRDRRRARHHDPGARAEAEPHECRPRSHPVRCGRDGHRHAVAGRRDDRAHRAGARCRSPARRARPGGRARAADDAR